MTVKKCKSIHDISSLCSVGLGGSCLICGGTYGFSCSSLQTDEVFLEAQIQNITTSPMFMEKVSLEPSMMYNVTELNTITSRDTE